MQGSFGEGFENGRYGGCYLVHYEVPALQAGCGDHYLHFKTPVNKYRLEIIKS